jgi:hypothetical protein
LMTIMFMMFMSFLTMMSVMCSAWWLRRPPCLAWLRV